MISLSIMSDDPALEGLLGYLAEQSLNEFDVRKLLERALAWIDIGCQKNPGLYLSPATFSANLDLSGAPLSLLGYSGIAGQLEPEQRESALKGEAQ